MYKQQYRDVFCLYGIIPVHLSFNVAPNFQLKSYFLCNI